MTNDLQRRIEDLVERAPDSIQGADADAVEAAVHALDRGEIRVASKSGTEWVVNEWVKEAILLYFRLRGIQSHEVGPFEYHDKIPLKHNYRTNKVRVVPPAVARYGSYLSEGVVLMPSYVNIGAWVGPGTMVDTWATIGSCAQIGAGVHVSGGVGIGGVLEPVQATPVIVEDNAFLGSRCIIVEGVVVGEGAVLGANVVVTGSTAVIDVTGDEPVEYRGVIPPRSVVIPGTRAKSFPAGDYGLPAALIVGRRSEKTDTKLVLNQMLREYGTGI